MVGSGVWTPGAVCQSTCGCWIADSGAGTGEDGITASTGATWACAAVVAAAAAATGSVTEWPFSSGSYSSYSPGVARWPENSTSSGSTAAPRYSICSSLSIRLPENSAASVLRPNGLANFSATRWRRARAPRRIRARRDSSRCTGASSSSSYSSSYSSSSTHVSSRRVRLLANVSSVRIKLPIFSAMLTQDQPVNSVRPAAQIQSSASVPPLL